MVDVRLDGAASGSSPRDAARVLKRHGKTFHWASRLLGKQRAQDAATLYAFCRHADDLVDEASAANRGAALEKLSEEVFGPGGDQQPFRDLARRCGFATAVVRSFLDGLRTDTETVRFRRRSELLRYCYGVASTVGLLMCDVLEVRDRRARAFAIDLGIAMQLTNICRDVLEDAERGRIYIPMPDHVTADHLAAGNPGARRLARLYIGETLDLAARYYRSADLGMRYLPWRARLAILTASRTYEAIGKVIRRRGDRYWQGRCYVGRAGKVWHTLRAMGAFVFCPRYWSVARSADHDSALHRALAGLPGAEVA